MHAAPCICKNGAHDTLAMNPSELPITQRERYSRRRAIFLFHARFRWCCAGVGQCVCGLHGARHCDVTRNKTHLSCLSRHHICSANHHCHTPPHTHNTPPNTSLPWCGCTPLHVQVLRAQWNGPNFCANRMNMGIQPHMDR